MPRASLYQPSGLRILGRKFGDVWRVVHSPSFSSSLMRLRRTREVEDDDEDEHDDVTEM